MSYSNVTRWVKSAKSGVNTINGQPRPVRPNIAGNPQNINKVKDLLKIDARLRASPLAKKVRITVGSVFQILKHLDVPRITVSRIPHLLNDVQKKKCVSMAQKVLIQQKGIL